MALRDITGGALWRRFLGVAFVAGQTIRQHLTRIRDTIVGSVRSRITEGWEAGETTRQIAERIRPPATVDGTGDAVAARAYRELDAVTSDALQGMMVEAQELLVTVNRGVVGRYVWIALLEPPRHPCPRCGALHGRVFRIDQSRVSLRTDRLFSTPTPPLHPRCACTLAYARTGEPLPAVQRFDEWLRDQDEETVVDVLGRTRARLFRDGELEVRDFVRGDEVLTLRELRRRNEDAFQAAGIENLRA